MCVKGEYDSREGEYVPWKENLFVMKDEYVSWKTIWYREERYMPYKPTMVTIGSDIVPKEADMSFA